MTSTVAKNPIPNSQADQWESVIGLEVHVQLLTQSKLFSGAATAYGAAPNTQACAIDLALPGVLPVLNAEAVTSLFFRARIIFTLIYLKVIKLANMKNPL